MRRAFLLLLLISSPALAHEPQEPSGARVFANTTTEDWLLEEIGIKYRLILRLIEVTREQRAEIERLKQELAKAQGK